MEYFICYIDPLNGRQVAVTRASSAEEAEKWWVRQYNPRCYNLTLVFVTNDRAKMGNFRDGRY